MDEHGQAQSTQTQPPAKPPPSPLPAEVQVTMSESFNEVFAALAKAQGEFAPVVKNCRNPHFGNTYADITAILDATRPALSKHGIAVVQLPTDSGNGAKVTTILGHSSGQWIRGDLRLPVGKTDAQGYGAAITYARRFALQSMLGVFGEEDDDAESIADHNQGRQPQRQAPPKQAPAKPRAEEMKARLQEKIGFTEASGDPLQTAAELARRSRELFAKAKTKGWTTEQLKVWCERTLQSDRAGDSKLWTLADIDVLEKAWVEVK